MEQITVTLTKGRAGEFIIQSTQTDGTEISHPPHIFKDHETDEASDYLRAIGQRIIGN